MLAGAKQRFRQRSAVVGDALRSSLMLQALNCGLVGRPRPSFRSLLQTHNYRAQSDAVRNWETCETPSESSPVKSSTRLASSTEESAQAKGDTALTTHSNDFPPTPFICQKPLALTRARRTRCASRAANWHTTLTPILQHGWRVRSSPIGGVKSPGHSPVHDVLGGRFQQREVEARDFRRQVRLLDGAHAHGHSERRLDRRAHQLAVALQDTYTGVSGPYPWMVMGGLESCFLSNKRTWAVTSLPARLKSGP